MFATVEKRLAESQFMTLDQLSEQVVIYTRSALPFPDGPTMAQDFAIAQDALSGLNTAKMGLLVDLRAAVGRNDEEFEREHESHRNSFVGRFPAVGVIVKSLVGRLQILRYIRHMSPTADVFSDPQSAREWLENQL